MSSDIISLETNIDEAASTCVQATFTGSPVGEIKLQASNHPAVLGYTDITTSITAISGAGSYMVNSDLPAYSYVRLVYTHTSGTGTLNSFINAKRR